MPVGTRRWVIVVRPWIRLSELQVESGRRIGLDDGDRHGCADGGRGNEDGGWGRNADGDAEGDVTGVGLGDGDSGSEGDRSGEKENFGFHTCAYGLPFSGILHT